MGTASRGSIAAKTSIALLHYPVYDKSHRVVATAVTTTDIHDMARAARTYGLERFHVVTPMKRQQWMVERILYHWTKGFGSEYNPTRKEALSLVKVVSGLHGAIEEMKNRWGMAPRIVATAARISSDPIGFPALRDRMENDPAPYMIFFGTGWGLTDEILSLSDFNLRPIWGGTDYNHLSVRCAAAIILDRLFGER